MDSIVRRPRGCADAGGLDAASTHQVQHLATGEQQIVGDNPSMATPPHRLGSHERRASLGGERATLRMSTTSCTSPARRSSKNASGVRFEWPAVKTGGGLIAEYLPDDEAQHRQHFRLESGAPPHLDGRVPGWVRQRELHYRPIDGHFGHLSR